MKGSVTMSAWVRGLPHSRRGCALLSVFALGVSFFSFTGGLAWADPDVKVSAVAPEQSSEPLVERVVILDSLPASDVFARAYVAELEARDVMDVELYHVGKEIPDELKALARWIVSPLYTQKPVGVDGKTYVHKRQMRVHFRRVTPEEFERAMEVTTNRVAPALADLVTRVEYQSPAVPSDLALDRATIERGIKADLALRVRHFLGIPRGFSWLTYKVKRAWQERLVDAGGALSRMPLTSGVLYLSLQSKIAKGEDLNLVLPLLIQGATSLFLDYNNGGNSDFQRQGVHYKFQDGVNASANVDKSLSFFATTQIIHSILIRQSIMLGAHITGNGINLGLDDIGDALSTTARGWVAKLYPERFGAWLRERRDAVTDSKGVALTEGQKTRRKWASIAWNQMWRTLYPALNIADMFGLGHLPRAVLTTGAVIGGIAEMWTRRDEIIAAFARDLRRLTGKFKVDDCQTLLVPRAPDGDSQP